MLLLVLIRLLLLRFFRLQVAEKIDHLGEDVLIATGNNPFVEGSFQEVLKFT